MTIYLTLLNAGYASYTRQSICHTLSATGWVKTASLVAPAEFAAASQSPTGLMVTGGLSGNDRLSTTQIFDGETFTLGTDIPVKTSSHCQVYTGTAVYIAGMCIYHVYCVLYIINMYIIYYLLYIIFTIFVLYIIYDMIYC